VSKSGRQLPAPEGPGLSVDEKTHVQSRGSAGVVTPLPQSAEGEAPATIKPREQARHAKLLIDQRAHPVPKEWTQVTPIGARRAELLSMGHSGELEMRVKP
jgi:hypothetical protein